MKKQKQINARSYKSGNRFIHRYQKLITDVVIPYQYEILKDNVEGVEKSHVIANFVNAGKALRGEDVGDGFYGMVFQDSDAAKWLEAVAYSLIQFPDKSLEEKADKLILLIENAQDSDGYLNTYFTIKDREKRWKNLLEGHELYCSGHFMEAAVAYYDATGKTKLLEVMERNAEHIYNHFIIEKNGGYPGHPEVELALMKMYRATKNKHCLELAMHFINVRGVDSSYYEKEFAARNWTVWGNNASDNNYQQSGKPVREQSNATGHSVRAVYLYTGMADLAAETDDVELLNACKRLWESVTNKQMYVTGAIGSTVLGEAFTVDYNLPNDTVYGETCASIGLMFFASRMLENEINSVYSNVMERAFYNTVLAGMQLDGKKFFYVNPLEIIPEVSSVAQTHKHTLLQRPEWYACACCPPNVARLISSFGKYAYGENETNCFCHLFAEGEVAFENGMKLVCKTEYPYSFTINYEILQGGKQLAIRIPDWSKITSIYINGKIANLKIVDGYAYSEILAKGDCIKIILDDAVKKIHATTKVASDSGAVALQRGPLVYCFEGIDNDSDVLSLVLPHDSKITACDFDKDLLNGTTKLTANGLRAKDFDTLYSFDDVEYQPTLLTAVPYYTWGNRGITQMRVWICEK